MKVMRLFMLCLSVGFFFGRPAVAQYKNLTDVAPARVTVSPEKARPGEVVTWKLEMNVIPGWHTYPTKQAPDSDAPVTKLVFPTFGEFVFVGDLKESEAKPAPLPEEPQENGASGLVLQIENAAVWERKFVVNPKAKPGKYKVKVDGRLIACDKQCFFGEPPTADFEILDGGVAKVDEKYSKLVGNFPLTKPGTSPPPEASPPRAVRANPLSAETPTPGATLSTGKQIVPPAATLDEALSNLEKLKEIIPRTEQDHSGLLAFIGAAVFWGAIALITPCVFPMIPITVSFFLKQSESEHHRPVRMAVIYCGTIVVVLGISALTLLTFFRALSVHWGTNILLGGLFLLFALSLFGVLEITLPSSWVAFTSQREGRGGTLGTVFMALTFTIVSFTCVAPFLGGFGGMVKSGKYSYFELVLGAFAFATTFASPFFVLALFPSLIKKLPQSGSWLNSVKVVMGFLEMAAALKFFRAAELRLLESTNYFTYDVVLSIWIALAIICGLYLLNFFRLNHDEPLEHIGVLRMLLGAVFICFAVYLIPALFKPSGERQRPTGIVYAWVDSFLLPEPSIAISDASETELQWSVNLKGTIDQVRKEVTRTGKPEFIFIDYTGILCTNCQLNERDVFSREDVKKLFKRYHLVQQYTDEVRAAFYPSPVDLNRREAEAKANLAFQDDRFGTQQLPLYVVIEVQRDKLLVRGDYKEGKINSVDKFKEFLRSSSE